MTLDELNKALTINLGGKLTDKLEELEQCSFIRSYSALGKVKKDTRYQLIDNFTLFHFKFIAEANKGIRSRWMAIIGTQKYHVWSGLAFERVCMQHENQLLKALGISGMECGIYSWTYRPQNGEEKGAQIDLLIDRSDNVINLCEMKFYSDPYTMTKADDDAVRDKKSIFQQVTQTRKAVRIVMITSYGLARNAYAKSIPNQLTMDDLFD